MPAMFGAGEGWSARWFIYSVAVGLGVAFSAILCSVAWNNALERNKREFSLQSVSLENTVFSNIRGAHNALNNLAAFLAATPELSGDEFRRISEELLDQHAYTAAMVYCPHVAAAPGAASCPVRQEVVRTGTVADSGLDLFSNSHYARLYEGGPVSQVLAATFPDVREGARNFWLVRLLHEAGASEGDAPAGIVAIAVETALLPGKSWADLQLDITLYNDWVSSGGRRLLITQPGDTSARGWTVSDFVEEGVSLSTQYSIKLSMSRPVFWAEVEKGLVYIALLIGAGVTLLLVALVRTKDLQARELRERNIVIERKVEEQTRELAAARDAALDASRVKSDFLASMSHEIRTPLNAIIGMSELLSETPLNSEQKKYTEVFRKAGDTLLSLVNDILDLSKIEARQVQLEAIPFDVAGVVEESAEIYALKAAEKGIELVSFVDPALMTARIGDPGRLRQILLNLISNALKFTERGEIVVRAEGDPEREPQYCRFSVSDSGIGIPGDKLESIFASFTQVDSSTTRKYGGTGLGLTICRSLVEMMGGRIRVESEPGRGSRFLFYVRLDADRSAPASRAPASDGLSGRRILLVDDNEASRAVVGAYLRHAGVDVREAGNGAAALEMLQSAPGFDLVLADCRMPGMDGFELLSTVSQRGAGPKTMMMLAAADLNRHMDRLKNAGVSAYLIKPVKRSELLRQAVTLLTGDAQAPVEKERGQLAEGSLRPLRILLVDDNPDNRLLVRAYLKKLPFELDEAENGQIAVEKFKQGDYDLVLMDVQMPVMDGHQATAAIRTWETNERRPLTPVIALTAHAIREEIDKCMAAGCSAHLSKPVKKNTLIEAIAKLTGERAAASGFPEERGATQPGLFPNAKP